MVGDHRSRVDGEEDGNDDDDDLSGTGTGNSEPGESSKVELVGDNGYDKGELLVRLNEAGFRTYIAEPKAPFSPGC